MIYLVIVLVWATGIVPAYKKISEWGNSEAEKYAFSLIWPLILPLYLIWYLHRKM